MQLRKYKNKFSTKHVLVIIITLIVLYTQSLIAQQKQEEEKFYYEISGLVFVNEYNLSERKPTDKIKVPDIPLKFNIERTETFYNSNVTVQGLTTKNEVKNNFSLYVIKFLKITYDPPEIKLDRDNHVNEYDNNKYFWIAKDEFDEYLNKGFIRKSFETNVLRPIFTYGASLSIPFKIRPGLFGKHTSFSPQVSIGGFVGPSWRLSRYKQIHLLIPFSVGITNLDINSENTSPSVDQSSQNFGLTFSAGAIIQVDDFQFGYIMGWDYSTGEAAKNWIYHKRPWYSVAIGYSFLNFGNNDNDNKK